MTRRRLPVLLSVVLAALAWAAPVSAGNWATATMDQPAPAPVAGVETTFGFVILQHGVTPASWVSATFVATDLEEGLQIQAPMRADGPNGHFVTSVTFPDTGDWTWYVMLAELGTDQEGAGGTLAVMGPAEAAVTRLTDLGRRLGVASDLLRQVERWLTDAARSASAG
jgi:hypothetical protein